MVKSRVFLVFVLLLIGGCGQSDFEGTWTGKAGPYLQTIRIDDKGNGFSCASWERRGMHSLEAITFSSPYINFKEGPRMKLVVGENVLIGEAEVDNARKISFYSDESLAAAAPYCKAALEETDSREED